MKKMHPQFCRNYGSPGPWRMALSGRKSMKALALVLLVGATISASADCIVSSVKAYPRWPWNGKVDIVYEIDEESGDTGTKFDVAFQIRNGDATVKMNHVEGVAAKSSSVMATDVVTGTGTHVLVWDAGADFPGEAVAGINCYVAAREYVHPNYMKVDLATGEVATRETAPSSWETIDKTQYMWFRWIEQGTFNMGAPIEEIGYLNNEGPVHEVTLTKGYWMAVFELTEGQYEWITDAATAATKSGSTKAKTKITYDDLRGTGLGSQWPTGTGVDSDSILDKLRTLVSNELADWHFDLPTEAQWEYACRAGNGAHKWGDGSDIESADGVDNNLEKLGWYVKNSGSKTHEVGQKSSNDWGLYDMHGNVWEWCLDWYDESWYDKSGANKDPVGPASGGIRVIRGGSWYGNARFCRSAYRYGANSSSSQINYGVRLALVSKTVAR